MNSSISRRLIFWLAIPLMLVALCGALVHYFNDVAPAMISSDRRLRESSNAVLSRVRIADGHWWLDTRADGRPQVPSADSAAFALRDQQGRLLLGDPRLPVMSLAGERNPMAAMVLFDRRYVRTLSTRFESPAGPVIATVADIRAAAEPDARLGLISTLLWDFAQLDVTLVLVWVGIQLGLRPVKRLRDEIAERSPLDLRPIEETSVPREIAPVVVTLNRLFKLMRASAQSQQQFISNTAHQLRTPITGMQAQLDLLIAEPAARPVEHRLLTLQEGIRQLSHAANQLLSLARADPAANLTVRRQRVDLQSLIGEVASRFFDRALQSGIDLGIDVAPLTVDADPSLLDDLLSNLVDNALKYTPAGGSVTVSAGNLGSAVFMVVEDTGPGIPPDERQRVRQRFYRMPNSPGHGSGLGLAIVDEIARLHDASVEIVSGAAGVGTRISVVFS